MNGVPLTYVTRVNEQPDHAKTFSDFSEEFIACAPLRGVSFQADDKTVHQPIVSFTTIKMCVRVPKTIQEAIDMCTNNGNYLC